MHLLRRFLGNPDRPFTTEMVANLLWEHPPTFHLLLMQPLDLDVDAVTLAVQSYHPEMSSARVETLVLPEEARQPGDDSSLIGLIGWGRHIIRVFGFDGPCPTTTYDACVQAAQFVDELKIEGRKHCSYVVLSYAGEESDPLEQHIALMAASTALCRFGAILLLNEAARAAFPAEALLIDEEQQDRLQAFRELPIPLFYGGLAKVEIEADATLWMRTFACHRLRLPNIAIRLFDHNEGNEMFDLIAFLLEEFRRSGETLVVGDRLAIGPYDLTARTPQPSEEAFLSCAGPIFVLDRGE